MTIDIHVQSGDWTGLSGPASTPRPRPTLRWWHAVLCGAGPAYLIGNIFFLVAWIQFGEPAFMIGDTDYVLPLASGAGIIAAVYFLPRPRHQLLKIALASFLLVLGLYFYNVSHLRNSLRETFRPRNSEFS